MTRLLLVQCVGKNMTHLSVILVLFLMMKRCWFPVIDGLCLTRFAPADYSETVNTLGVPHYAQAEPKRMNRGFDLECQSNPVSIVTVPLAVRRLKLKAAVK
ncbi:major capsid protein [Aliivibrio salmonicida]|uniref:major capsid protein n=1 Tax=Aliivibrio salmonicida TaxID=40269 RepID=UPI00406C046B